MKKSILTLGALTAGTSTMVAQTIDAGAQALNNAAGQVNQFYVPMTNLVFAIAGCVALVGAIRIFIAWNSGDRDIGKMVVGWVGACIFLVAVGLVITGFFGAQGG